MQCSLRLRLLAAWAVFIILTLQVAGIGLRLLFERSITERTQTELEADLRQLERGMEISPSGVITVVREPTDPQFDIEFGGRYWQIDEKGKTILRSPSLKDTSLKYAGVTATQSRQIARLEGPLKQHLFAVVQNYAPKMPAGGAAHDLTIVTAVDLAEIEEDTGKFSSDLWQSLIGLALLLLLGAWVHVSIGLRPLEALRAKVAAVRDGTSSQLDGDFPSEVMPLVAETKALLQAQSDDLQSARQRAADLAHGLNTPLTIMAAKSRALQRKGEIEIAGEIDAQIETMRRHVERELARARARGSVRSGQTAIDVVPLARDLIAAIGSIPRQPQLMWNEELPGRLKLGVDGDDFNNILGNLLENAQKWAKSCVRVSASKHDAGVEIDVEDDGPGVPEEQISRVLLRGERADTTVRGNGLGLAIVSDLVELYRGELKLTKSSLGGLKVSVLFPH